MKLLTYRRYVVPNLELSEIETPQGLLNVSGDELDPYEGESLDD